MFAPDIHGDFLYMDLDTVIVGPLDDLLAVKKLTLLRDFYRNGVRMAEGLQSSLMFLPASARPDIWRVWNAAPVQHMADNHRGGDQVFLERKWLTIADRWQDVVPGQVVSWKVDCHGGNNFQTPVVPADARVIVFHGNPRPWSTPQFKHLYG